MLPTSVSRFLFLLLAMVVVVVVISVLLMLFPPFIVLFWDLVWALNGFKLEMSELRGDPSEILLNLCSSEWFPHSNTNIQCDHFKKNNYVQYTHRSRKVFVCHRKWYQITFGMALFALADWAHIGLKWRTNQNFYDIKTAVWVKVCGGFFLSVFECGKQFLKSRERSQKIWEFSHSSNPKTKEMAPTWYVVHIHTSGGHLQFIFLVKPWQLLDDLLIYSPCLSINCYINLCKYAQLTWK